MGLNLPCIIMKAVLILIIVVHGLIHLLGFFNAFGLSKIPALSSKTIIPVSAEGKRFLGILWLLATVLFTITGISYVWDKHNWWMIGLAAVTLSQLLVIVYWKNAKAGTIANLFIIFPLIITLFTTKFHRESLYQKQQINNASYKSHGTAITTSDLQSLPATVQQWLLHSGVVGKPMIKSVTLKQQGEMLTKPGGKWMPFRAEQVFTGSPPAFVWEARIDMLPGILIHGRDVFENGKGHMLIKPLGVITIADAGGKETDQGTLLRYLAETCWFPSAAPEPYITWEPISDSSAKATMTYRGSVASGIFTYNKAGDIIRFEALRYYEQKGQFSLEKWIVDCTLHQEKNGIRIPVRSTVTWGLQSGDFTWLKLDITEIKYSYQ
jgi:hypothetical protein